MVEKVMILTAPVVSLLYVLPGWTAKVLSREGGDVVALSRKGSSERSRYIPVHDVREEFAAIVTIEDAEAFFEKHGPFDSNREFSLSQVRTVQERIKHYRTMHHRDFFGPKKDLHHWAEASGLSAQLMVGSRPFWSLEAFDVWTAIKNATFIDHVRQVRAGTCQQCGKLFELPERRKQLYCDKACQNKATKTRWNKKHGGKQDGKA
jgi:hypothetical protein